MASALLSRRGDIDRRRIGGGQTRGDRGRSLDRPDSPSGQFKDSFACLDLDKHGFLPLFDAECFTSSADR